MDEQLVTTVDGDVLRVRSQGAGPGLVLLHGGGVVSRDYDRLARALATSMRVHVYDRRGRPGSAPLHPDHSIETDVGDLESVLAATGAARLFGHSGGAFIALQAALRLPLESVAVYDPGLGVDGLVPVDFVPAMAAAVQAGDHVEALLVMAKGSGTAGAMAHLPLPVQRALVGAFLRTPPGRRLDELLPTVPTEVREIAAHAGPASDYAGIQIPVLLAAGARSADHFAAVCHALAAVMPKATALVMPRMSHNAANIARPAFVRPFAEFFHSR